MILDTCYDLVVAHFVRNGCGVTGPLNSKSTDLVKFWCCMILLVVNLGHGISHPVDHSSFMFLLNNILGEVLSAQVAEPQRIRGAPLS